MRLSMSGQVRRCWVFFATLRTDVDVISTWALALVRLDWALFVLQRGWTHRTRRNRRTLIQKGFPRFPAIENLVGVVIRMAIFVLGQRLKRRPGVGWGVALEARPSGFKVIWTPRPKGLTTIMRSEWVIGVCLTGIEFGRFIVVWFPIDPIIGPKVLFDLLPISCTQLSSSQSHLKFASFSFSYFGDEFPMKLTSASCVRLYSSSGIGLTTSCTIVMCCSCLQQRTPEKWQENQ